VKKDDSFNKIAKIFEEDGYVFHSHFAYGDCFLKSFETNFIVSNVLILHGLSKGEITVRVERKSKEGYEFFMNLVQDKFYIKLDKDSTSIIESIVFFTDLFISGLEDKIDMIYSHANVFHVTAIVYKTHSRTNIVTKYNSGCEELRFEITHTNDEAIAYTNKPITKTITINDLMNRDLSELVNEVKDFCKI
jgi:hypothetical protein